MKIKNKFLIPVFFLLGSWFLVPGSAFATETPQQSVQAFLDDVNEMQFPIVDMAHHKELVARADLYLDLDALAKKAMQNHWAEMKPEDQKAFMDLLWKLIRNIAYPRTKNFLGGEKISYTEPKPIALGVELASTARDREAALDVPVVYNLEAAGANWKIYDVFLDGVSITEDLKYQFDKMLKDGSVANLLAKMNDRLVKAEKATGWQK